MIKENLGELSSIFKNHSPLYIVGGFIRDKLLGLNPSDVDLCSALTLDKVKEILQGTKFKICVKNKTFGTATITNEEITFEYSVLREDFYKNGKFYKHSPDKVIFTSNINIDATRRDFTINTMYYNLLTNELIDIYNARNHLEQKILKMVTPTTLNYDGERILRLVRFAVSLNFSIEENTLDSAKRNAKNVLALSESVKKKFLDNTKSYSNEQKQRLKDLLKDLQLTELINY